MPLFAIESAPGGGKTSVLAALAAAGHTCHPEPPPTDDSADAVAAQAVNSLRRFMGATDGFIERSPQTVAMACRLWARDDIACEETFTAIAQLLLEQRIDGLVHVCLGELPKGEAAALQSCALIDIDVAGLTPTQIANAIIERLNPNDALFM